MKSLTNAAQMLDASRRNLFPLQVQQPRTQTEIMRNWGGAYEPVVSICCATFNHVSYIEDAIRGFLAQETTFAFEIIIRDDASTDGTTDIVQDYSKRYPDIIRPLVNSENRFGLGERAIHAWPSAVRGEYCAICEGDDFWISPVRLQRQFELLEKYPKAVMSVARSHYYRQDKEELCYLRTTIELNEVLLDFEELCNADFHTSTFLIRANLFKEVIREYFAGHALYGDAALRAILIMHGPFALLSDVVSVYRVTGAGIWSRLSRGNQLKWELAAARKLADTLPGFHGKFQRQRIYGIMMSLLRFHVKNVQIIEAIKIAPSVFWYGLIKVPDYIQRKLKSVSQA